MSRKKGSFFLSRRFLPLFIVQATGAFNDNLLKQALGLFIIYNTLAFANGYTIARVPAEMGIGSIGGSAGDVVMFSLCGIGFSVDQVLIIINVLFTVPFFLFSALAGQLADKFDKSQLIRAIKLFECGIMLVAAAGFTLMNIWLLLIALFLMGLHSSLFGPIKYSILPDHLSSNELVSGNALVEGGTFLSILLGTLIAGPVVQLENATTWVSIILFFIAALGLWAAWRVPSAPIAESNLQIDWNIIRSTFNVLKYCRASQKVFMSIMGIAWFWVLGALYVTLLAPIVKDILGGSQEVVSSFIAIFSIGIAVGSLLCSRVLHGEITAKYLPFAAIALTCFTLDFAYCASLSEAVANGQLKGIFELFDSQHSIRIILDLFGIAVAGGFFVIPLYAIMQHEADDVHRARIVAGSNIINALSIIPASGLVMLLQMMGFTVVNLYVAFGLLNLLVVALIGRLIPRSVVLEFARVVVRLFHRPTIEDEALWHQSLKGGRVVGVANHISSLDPLFLAIMLPGDPVIVLSLRYTRVGRLRDRMVIWVLGRFFKTAHIDGDNPFSVKGVVQALKENGSIIIFPEGRVSATGVVMKVSELPFFIARKGSAKIVPLHIDGLQFSFFSRLSGKLRRKLFPKVRLSVGAPIEVDEPTQTNSRQRGSIDSMNRLYDMLTALSLKGTAIKLTFMGALLEAAYKHGFSRQILEDSTRAVLTYRGLLLRSLIFSSLFKRLFKNEKVVGVLMPNCNAHVVSFFGLSLANIVPAELNFSAGVRHVSASCKAAEIKQILTIKRLWEDSSSAALRQELSKHVKVHFLDDISEQITWWHKVKSFFILVPLILGASSGWLLLWGLDRRKYDDVGVILFTSGSEGSPKGVALAYQAVVSNFRQLDARVEFAPIDKVFNALPLFHSFGLSIGTLLPLFSGMSLFLYPSPLHYKAIADLIYETEATMLFGTDTFLRGYARAAHPYDFFSLKYVFAGAEKLSESTRQLWFERFGIRIFEGYGTTETAPVLSINTNMFYKAGSVGKFLPGVDYRCRSLEGVEADGVLEVRGPNVMIGYLRESHAGVIERLDTGDQESGWYDTGDIVNIDEDGFIFIVGREKRFAKIAGEMISLLSVERILEDTLSDARCAVIARRHATRGEELILFTDSEMLTRKEVQSVIREAGLSLAAAPREVRCLSSLPLLPSGKVDYALLREMLLSEEVVSEDRQVS